MTWLSRYLAVGAKPWALRVADIVLINPKFEFSFWGLEHALPFFGKRATMPVVALPLLAALTPSEHRVTNSTP
jgi:hypothetical protein